MITYTLSMPAPHSHLYHVQIEVDGADSASQDLILPSWTPGSYMIRDYARHVQSFTASTLDGTPLHWYKVAKDSWRVETDGVSQFRVMYQVYANELTVRTSHLDGSHGYVNGATLFMYVEGRTAEHLQLTVVPAAGWQVTTSLLPLDREHTTFSASDYDELVDSPIECGTHRLLQFEVDRIPHQIALWGHGNEDEARIVADTQRIVEIQRDFFGSLPYSHYIFILHLVDGRGGGLEHRNSVTNQVDRWSFQPRRAYERFIRLTSHELFHVWNVKRLRPAPLGPFNYRAENYTRMLWLMEGATSYYDDLLLVRAGLISPERYLELLAEQIVQLQSQPGRLLQSLEQSSFDAWIKFYRPDEHSANSSISYYLKGALVCLLLDMAIRTQSGGTRSFDDLMRYLYERYPITGPGIPEVGALQAAAEAVAGSEPGFFHDFFTHYIAGTTELDYSKGLATVGLELHWQRRGPAAWLGVSLKQQGERTLIRTVRADGPAYLAGIYADDELLALDGWRVDSEKFNARLAERKPGASVRLTLFRGDRLLEVTVTLAEAPPDALELTSSSERSAAQQQAYQKWLGITT